MRNRDLGEISQPVILKRAVCSVGGPLQQTSRVVRSRFGCIWYRRNSTFLCAIKSWSVNQQERQLKKPDAIWEEERMLAERLDALQSRPLVLIRTFCARGTSIVVTVLDGRPL